jgi:hypothetical protein
VIGIWVIKIKLHFMLRVSVKNGGEETKTLTKEDGEKVQGYKRHQSSLRPILRLRQALLSLFSAFSGPLIVWLL